MSDEPDEPKRDAQITLRLPSALLEAVKKEAKRDRRSAADIIVYMLEERYGMKKSRSK